jgi:membrane-associated phospholipid phosphatase
VSALPRLTSIIESFHLTRRAVVAVIAAVVAVGTTVMVFAKSTDDVSEHNGLSIGDPSRLRFFIDHRNGALVHAAKTVTTFGAAPILAVLAVAAAGFLWWRGAPFAAAIAPGLALGVAGAVAGIVKTAVDRARPPISVRLLTETEPSFPSGHASDSAAFYLALALAVAVFVFRRPIARVAVVAVGALAAGLVGTSRLVLGVHWPSDVLAGWALGMSCAVAVVLVAALAARLEPPERHSDLRASIYRVLYVRRSPGLRTARASLDG